MLLVAISFLRNQRHFDAIIGGMRHFFAFWAPIPLCGASSYGTYKPFSAAGAGG